MKQIILASSSPRRKELFAFTKLPYRIVPSEYEEDNTLPLLPDELVKELAIGKAQWVAERYPDAIIIGVDTLIATDDKVIGKPRDKQELTELFRSFSGTSHSVFSGVAIIEGQRIVAENVETRVFFRTLTDKEIEQYAETDEWQDKAGGYGIQATGALFIEKIEGDYFNVVGLPLCKLGLMLKEFNVEITL